MRTSITRLLFAGAMLFPPASISAQDFGVEFPANPAPGVVFPTSETEINKWVFSIPQDNKSIYQHGWGLWAGLTTETSETAFGIDNALIYQTWQSPDAIKKLLQGEALPTVLSLRTPQIRSGARLGPELSMPSQKSDRGMYIDYSIAETVAYSPQSARHAYSNELLLEDVLKTYISEGYLNVPSFPAPTINIKPVYKLITKEELNPVGGSLLYAMPAWPGTPDTTRWTEAQKKAGFPNTLWDQCIY